jgi:hypothetical protein
MSMIFPLKLAALKALENAIAHDETPCGPAAS